MSSLNSVFHTATVDHQVPGPPVVISALAYNLQYTRPLVTELAESNPPVGGDTQVFALRERRLVRVTLYGQHPSHPSRRLCVIGVGDDRDRAEKAARDAWFDFHASVLFTGPLREEGVQRVAIRHRVPGMPAQRAAIVGVAYELEYLRPVVDAAVARNLPSGDEYHVVHSGELTLMRVNLFGRHPLDSQKRVGVAGIADRHFRAKAAAEQAWATYHTSVLLAASALGSV
ncbi:MAG TPA: hypothetical protein VEF89_24095 [Solirubrobacteraceae bacterium]|nr:hypothetical protein [Solirubrobacteraceae bacterium]